MLMLFYRFTNGELGKKPRQCGGEPKLVLDEEEALWLGGCDEEWALRLSEEWQKRWFGPPQEEHEWHDSNDHTVNGETSGKE